MEKTTYAAAISDGDSVHLRGCYDRYRVQRRTVTLPDSDEIEHVEAYHAGEVLPDYRARRNGQGAGTYSKCRLA